MHLLLDTHILLWFLSANTLLKKEKKRLINDTDNIIYVSLISLWEIAIKLNIGKLDIDFEFSDLPMLLKNYDIQVLGLTFPQLAYFRSIEKHHSDPFDRMIIAQAITENLTIITEDQNFKLYQVKLV